jgi:hypothetical protein
VGKKKIGAVQSCFDSSEPDHVGMVFIDFIFLK